MKRFQVLCAVVATMVAGSRSLHAQTCIGLPSTAVAPVNLSLGAAFPEGSKGYEARLGFGGASGFGGVTAGYLRFDESDASATVFGVDAGVPIAANASRSVQLCPVVQGAYRNGPKFNDDLGSLELTGQSALGGLALGGAIEVSPAVALIPFVQAGVLYSRSKVTIGSESESSSDTGGALSGGVSLRFSDVFLVTPRVFLPVGFEGDSDAVFSISATIGFRR